LAWRIAASSSEKGRGKDFKKPMALRTTSKIAVNFPRISRFLGVREDAGEMSIKVGFEGRRLRRNRGEPADLGRQLTLVGRSLVEGVARELTLNRSLRAPERIQVEPVRLFGL